MTLDVVVYTFNPSTWEAELYELQPGLVNIVSSRSVKLHSETLPQKSNKQTKILVRMKGETLFTVGGSAYLKPNRQIGKTLGT